MAGLDGDGGKFWVNLEKNGNLVRIGPYKEPAKAKLRHRLEINGWNSAGKKGKKPELILQPKGVHPDPALTTPSQRLSPRTGKLSPGGSI